MDNFLKVINELQDVFSTVGTSPDSIKLPQIVVVGSQSAGKSSVLESIVRKNFLPRGGGIVTRRPLIIQITQDNQAVPSWACFLHSPDKKYTDFNKVRDEIVDETDRICGNSKNILPDPITLKIYAADLPTLTLVDLPGIVKVPVGDQPENIEEQTINLVKSFVQNPNSIILAVSPGNVDLANSEALKMARQVDPDSKRTLAVITKADLMEKTTENRLVLEGKSIPVKLGIIGVINRSQAKIDEGQPIDECIAHEEMFFKTNYNYISGEMGTPYLTKRLCKILLEHVKECLPELIIRITEQKVLQQGILDSLGKQVEDPFDALVQLLYEFCQNFDRNIEGKESIKLTSGREMSGGRHLFEQFEDTIGKDLEQIILPENIEQLIEHEIMSSSGAKPALFTPNVSFENLASNQIKCYVQPVKKSIKKCCETITEITLVLSRIVFRRFPNLRREAHHVCLSLILTQTQAVEQFMADYLKCEIRYINTNHKLFTKDRKRIEEESRDEDAQNMPFEKQNVRRIRALLELYLNIIKNQLMDVVPKTVMSFMVYAFKEDLQKNLIKQLTKQDKVEELMKEDPFIEEKRAKATKMLRALEQADAVTCILD
ncbi:hypothetical protein ACHWQZ_G010167 [Mnemiopsis leidyi]